MISKAADSFRMERLGPQHDRESFSCGVDALDRYLHQQAGQDAKRNTAVVSILTQNSISIAGFYTLSALSVPFTDIPAELQKKLPRTPIPATLLGRMAVSELYKGQRLGTHLLMHALRTAYESSRTIASWAVIVDAKESARGFYLKFDFKPFMDNHDRLYLSMADIARAISLAA